MRFEVCHIKIEKLEDSVGPEPMVGVRLDSIELEEDVEAMEKQVSTNTSGRT